MIRIVICILISLIFLSPNIVSGKSKIVDFSLGCATSLLIHEAAHWIVGNTTGEFTFEPDKNGWPVAIYEGDNEGLFKTASAGFMSTLLLREYYLQKRPEGDIWQGIFWGSVCFDLLYCLEDGGDFRLMSRSSRVSVGTLHTILVTLTALDIYRYYHNERGISFSILPKAVSFGLVLTFK